MASRRKGWSELSDTYRARLERQGVTRQQYESGASLSAARGHSVTPERLTGYIGRANELGIGFIASEFDEYLEAMSRDEAAQTARNFVLGYMTRGKTNKLRIEARMDFNTWLLEMRGGEMSREDWRTYRALYMAHFGGRKA